MFTIIIREHALAAHAARRRDRPCGRIGTEAKVIALWCSAAAAAALHTDEVESRQVPQRRRADRVREEQVAGHVAVTSRVAESGRGSRQSRRRCGATGSGVTLPLCGTVPTWHRLMAVAVFTPADATVSACPRVLRLRYGASATAPPRRRPLQRRLPVPSERSWLTLAPSIRERLRDAARVERLALNYSSILGPLSMRARSRVVCCMLRGVLRGVLRVAYQAKRSMAPRPCQPLHTHG